MNNSRDLPAASGAASGLTAERPVAIPDALSQRPNAPQSKLRRVSKHRRFAAPRTVSALMLREMATSYGRSGGGFLWAVLEPVAGIILLTAIFSIAVRKPAIGINFPIFYATGIIPFGFYLSISNNVSQAVTFSRSLLGYPAVTIPDAIFARVMVNTIAQLLVGYLVFTTILLLYHTRTTVDITAIALSYAMALVLGLGVGTLNIFMFARFPVWKQIWGVAMRPLMLVSCVINIYDQVPRPYNDYLWWNPIVHVVGQMRKGFYASYPGDYISPAYVFLVGGILFVFGLALTLHFRHKIVNEW